MEKTWKQRDDKVGEPEVEGNDEEEGATDANKKQATSAIQKTPPRFKKGNSNLDCISSIASNNKVGDISVAPGVAKATTATGGSVLEQLLALPEHEQASLLSRLAALGPAKTGGISLAANEIVDGAASNSKKSPPETLGTSSGGINEGAGGDSCLMLILIKLPSISYGRSSKTSGTRLRLG